MEAGEQKGNSEGGRYLVVDRKVRRCRQMHSRRRACNCLEVDGTIIYVELGFLLLWMSVNDTALVKLSECVLIFEVVHS
jgi:hypothetical protein